MYQAIENDKIAVERVNLIGLYHAFVPPNSMGFRKEKNTSTTAAARLAIPNQSNIAFFSFKVAMNSIYQK